MLQLAGKVINLFTVEGGTDKDGKDYAERHKVQLMGSVLLQNGDTKFDLLDLTVPNISDWSGLQNKDITVQIGAFAPEKNTIVYFVPKGVKPQLMGAS
ncbi:Uncharacterised protein [Moraxella caprae]|uniref:Uncharacterized protein n=1 Tax=Moraxella caprae TaxID=90240 RepID=A0A378QH27_9GAMM|nr:hypothetical protein [Moraxella caprae]STY98623.1 Uncharacterised protein [Moraxella caprae]